MFRISLRVSRSASVPRVQSQPMTDQSTIRYDLRNENQSPAFTIPHGGR